MPKPLPNETKDEYIPRCISFMHKEGKYPQKQGIAICYSMWENKDKKKDESIETRINLFLEQGTYTTDVDVTPCANKSRKKTKMLRRGLQNI
jgi:hypothetical protein